MDYANLRPRLTPLISYDEVLQISHHSPRSGNSCMSNTSHDIVGGGAVRSGTGFRGVRESEAGGIDDSVVPDQSHWDLSGLSDPGPSSAELGDVGDNAEHAFLTPVHCLGLHVAKPDPQVGGEAFACQLEHGDVATAVQVKRRDNAS